MLLTTRYLSSLVVEKQHKMQELEKWCVVCGVVLGPTKRSTQGDPREENPFLLQCLFSTLYQQKQRKVIKGPKSIFSGQAVKGEFGAERQ